MSNQFYIATPRGGTNYWGGKVVNDIGVGGGWSENRWINSNPPNGWFAWDLCSFGVKVTDTIVNAARVGARVSFTIPAGLMSAQFTLSYYECGSVPATDSPQTVIWSVASSMTDLSTAGAQVLGCIDFYGQSVTINAGGFLVFHMYVDQAEEIDIAQVTYSIYTAT